MYNDKDFFVTALLWLSRVALSAAIVVPLSAFKSIISNEELSIDAKDDDDNGDGGTEEEVDDDNSTTDDDDDDVK